MSADPATKALTFCSWMQILIVGLCRLNTDTRLIGNLLTPSSDSWELWCLDSRDLGSWHQMRTTFRMRRSVLRIVHNLSVTRFNYWTAGNSRACLAPCFQSVRGNRT